MGGNVYKTRWFKRWCEAEGIGTEALCSAVRELARGLHDAELGSGLYKKRVARPGRGKSSGFRTLIATNNQTRWVFVYGFSKSQRENIDRAEGEALRLLAKHLMSMSSDAMDASINAGELMEVACDAKD